MQPLKARWVWLQQGFLQSLCLSLLLFFFWGAAEHNSIATANRTNIWTWWKNCILFDRPWMLSGGQLKRTMLDQVVLLTYKCCWKKDAVQQFHHKIRKGRSKRGRFSTLLRFEHVWKRDLFHIFTTSFRCVLKSCRRWWVSWIPGRLTSLFSLREDFVCDLGLSKGPRANGLGG